MLSCSKFEEIVGWFWEKVTFRMLLYLLDSFANLYKIRDKQKKTKQGLKRDTINRHYRNSHKKTKLEYKGPYEPGRFLWGSEPMQKFKLKTIDLIFFKLKC